MSSMSLNRADAVKEIANHVADRDRFLVAVSLQGFASCAYAFSEGTVRCWRAYVDCGGPTVLCTDDGQLLESFTRGAPGSAVLAVPKTVPAAVLGAVFDQAFPEDGSRDLIDLDTDFWPSLVFEALEAVDPQSAARMRAAYGAQKRPELPRAL